jgi:Zn-dependent protease with chaperone function
MPQAADTASVLRQLHQAAQVGRLGDLTVLESSCPEALALPGLRGSVVVTSAMLSVLDAEQQQVLLAHERCHARHHHWLFRLAVRAAAAAFPPARLLVADCDQALERWADEAAASSVGDRHLAARAVATAALAIHDHRSGVASAGPGFSGGAVAERVHALLAPSPRRRRWPLLPLAGAGLLTLAVTLEASTDLKGAFEVAKHVWRLHQ